MRRILIILFICQSVILINTYSIEFQRVDLYSLKDGISQSVVTCLFIDSKGFLWIGTQDGLNRYDGYKFKVYRHLPYDNSTLSNNYIRSINEYNGSLIIATDNGLSRFNLQNNVFENYYFNQNDTLNSLPENRVYSIYKDANNIFWIKTDNYVSKFFPEEGRFENFKHFNDPGSFYQEYNQYNIIEDSLGYIWIGTKDGLLRINKKDNSTKYYFNDINDRNSIGNNHIKCLFINDQGQLLIGTDRGIYIFNYADESFNEFSILNSNVDINKQPVNFIYQDHNQYYWIGTNTYLYLFDKNRNLLNQKIKFETQERLIQNTLFTCAKEDNSKILWIGTFNGLIKIDQKGLKFKLYNKTVPAYQDLASEDIASIMVDSDNKIWVGTWNSGLNIIEHGKTAIDHFDTESSIWNKKLCNNGVHALMQDKNGFVYIGTEDGVNVYDGRTKALYNLCDLFNTVQLKTFQKNRVNNIYYDKKNAQIIFSSNHGLHILNTENKSFKSIYDLKRNGKSIPFDNIYSVVRDSKNNLWVGTNNGLYVFTEDFDEYKYYEQGVEPRNSTISNNSVLCVFEDSYGYIWMGTAAGLNKYDYASNTFQVYTENDGIPNTLIYNILEDQNHNLWMSTNSGLVMMDRVKNEFIVYDIADGLQSNEFNYGAAFRNTKTNEIFFGGISGFNSFYPDSIVINNLIPKIEITAFEIIHKDRLEWMPLGDNESIILPEGSNVFTIEFSALDYTWPQKNQYAYMLIREGSEEEWVELGNIHQATFSNLRSGKYIFKVKGSNSDNVWNNTGKTIYITIKAPIWKSLSASILYLISFIFLVFYIYMNRTRNLRKLNRGYKEREIINEQIARQKDELSIKNKNITDSINYAKRIQEAMMPSKNLFNKLLPESFVLHKPKDIVSGDFYWINENNGKIFVAAVDCTGHGVPGAFMSIIGFELFRKITNIQGIEEPGEIMNLLNKNFGDIFKDVENFSLKDGMDIAFCVIDKKRKIVEYAGAFNPLYIVRDNKISEVKGDRFSVGIDEELIHDQAFTNHMVSLEQDDVLYLFTDGYADQFGGDEGKKFKYRRFRHLLLNIHMLSMDEQREVLDKTIEDWKGDFEQIDDILVIGIKP